jgi:hypothetical protein
MHLGWADMDLFYVLVNINEFSEEHTLYVEQPWTLESETRLIEEATAQTLYYNHQAFERFLEISLIDELLLQYQQHNVCLREQCQQILEYALKKRG